VALTSFDQFDRFVHVVGVVLQYEQTERVQALKVFGAADQLFQYGLHVLDLVGHYAGLGVCKT